MILATKNKVMVNWKRVSSFHRWSFSPGAPLTNFNDGGGSERGSYFIPQKITTSEFVYQKKSLSPFFATQKNPSVFFSRPQKIPASFIDPKKSRFAKISDPKIITRTPPPPVIKICHWGPWEIQFVLTSWDVRDSVFLIDEKDWHF